MGVVFRQGETIGRGSLQLFLSNNLGVDTNAAQISYAIYYMSPVPPFNACLWGCEHRMPVNPAVGEYYASIMFPDGMTIGNYRIVWTFKKYENFPLQQAIEEFGIISGGF
jgi:hypothetical protein